MKREENFYKREHNKPAEKQMMQMKNNLSSPTKQCPSSHPWPNFLLVYMLSMMP